MNSRRLSFERVEDRDMLTVAVDFDLDGDVDLLSEGTLYENSDGYGNFREHAFSDSSCDTCVAADLDDDGAPDVITTHGWYRNVDGIRFEEIHPFQLPTDFRASGLRIDDLDLDGDLDVLLHDATRVLQLTQTDGEFEVVLDTAVEGRILDLADFNHDRLIDVVSQLPSRELGVFQQHSDGTFTLHQLTHWGPDFYASLIDAIVADLNGDGWDDIFVVNSIDWGEYFSAFYFANEQQTASPQFDSAGNFVRLEVCSLTCRTSVMDVDRDGDLDVLATEPGLNYARSAIIENNGTGQFHLLSQTSAQQEVISDLATDLNGDRIIDYVSIDAPPRWYDHARSMWHTPGSLPPIATATATTFIESTQFQLPMRVRAIADLDGDNTVEIMGTVEDKGFRVFTPDGNSVDVQVSSSRLHSDRGADQMAARDMNGDGRLDIVFSIVGQVYWMENLGGLVFGDAIQITSGLAVWPPWGFGDLNGDGRTDVVVGIEEDAGRFSKRLKLQVAMSNQDGHVEQEITLPGNSNRHDRLAIVDVDNDGDEDVLVAVRHRSTRPTFRHYLIENRNGELQPMVLLAEFPARGHRMQIAIADTNGDGQNDLMYADHEGLVLRDAFVGDTTMIEAELNTSNVDTSQLRLTDLDNDGAPDILLTFHDRIVVHNNIDGTGSFAEALEIGRAADVYFIVSHDVDLDGDQDILTVGAGNVLKVFEQRPAADSNNDGVFDSRDLVAVFQAGEYEDDSYRNSTFETGDWNGDGEFNSADLVHAFQVGGFHAGAAPLENDVAAAICSDFSRNDKTNRLRKSVA